MIPVCNDRYHISFTNDGCGFLTRFVIRRGRLIALKSDYFKIFFILVFFVLFSSESSTAYSLYCGISISQLFLTFV